eukprot:CAMPEP_0115438574 /NCGR_PEP_ID=MMETSP0271-20121206/35328_1 /TAXON_ID=71861 /ORGANISM="Scrippsiella trochoidea, Strain CCMP3099" /LENGTH=277 /DNA_ID=CAMNT_0002864233 /DNA_START=85 /DNA_END=916 /DNA_ORIENTATION=+
MTVAAYLQRRGAAPASGSLFESMALEGGSAVQTKKSVQGRLSAKVLRVQQKPADDAATHMSTSLSSALVQHDLPRQSSGSDASSGDSMGGSSGVSNSGGWPRGDLLLKNPPPEPVFVLALGLDGAAGAASGCTRVALRRRGFADRRVKRLAAGATALMAQPPLGGKDLDALSTALPTQESLPFVAELPPHHRQGAAAAAAVSIEVSPLQRWAESPSVQQYDSACEGASQKPELRCFTGFAASQWLTPNLPPSSKFSLRAQHCEVSWHIEQVPLYSYL